MFHLWYRYLRSHKSLGQIVSRSSYLFEHLHLLSSDFLLLRSYPPLIFSLLTSFMSLLFHLSMLSKVRLLTFIFLPLPFCRCSWSSSFYRFTVLPFYRFTVLPLRLLHLAFYHFTVLPFYRCLCFTVPFTVLPFYRFTSALAPPGHGVLFCFGTAPLPAFSIQNNPALLVIKFPFRYRYSLPVSSQLSCFGTDFLFCCSSSVSFLLSFLGDRSLFLVTTFSFSVQYYVSVLVCLSMPLLYLARCERFQRSVKWSR